uniref:Uncharacterized protein n=1 Tax=Octopus bimaculoides TaxID=37653 RepID=A0A0L8G6F9_OCTBM
MRREKNRKKKIVLKEMIVHKLHVQLECDANQLPVIHAVAIMCSVSVRYAMQLIV